MNSVNLTGRLTRDIETRQTQSGKTVSSFTLAVEGNRKEDDASFINCVLWAHDGLLPYLTKGKQVGASGRLQTRSYESKQGQKVFVTEVVVFGIDLLGGSNNQGGNQPNRNNSHQGNSAPKHENPFNSNPDTIDIPDSDLPF